jgi:hypothetical protein
MTPAVIEETFTTCSSVVPISKNTVATDKFNGEDFSRNYKDRLLGLYEIWTNRMLAGKEPETLYRFPKTQFIDMRTTRREQDTKLYLSFQLSQWNNTHTRSIADIHSSVSLLYGLWGITVWKYETEKDLFIRENKLSAAIDSACKFIKEIFTCADISDDLYIDPEEPEYKFLNMTITPEIVSESDIPSLLDRFDTLQDRFLTTLDRKYTSKITFHLDIP